MNEFIAYRRVVPELLDQLPPQDPRAMGSRRDLQRLNFWMGNARAIRSVLVDSYRKEPPTQLVELGGGDGTFLLRLAKLLPRSWAGSKVFLVDRQPSVTSQTLAAFDRMGWNVEIIAADVFEWLPSQASLDAVAANLFLHHFDRENLEKLLALICERARSVVACEPRRCAMALGMGSMLRLIGCNAVTRHDAPISVRAGFRARELSAAWPDSNWQLREGRSGLFTHLFTGRKLTR